MIKVGQVSLTESTHSELVTFTLGDKSIRVASVPNKIGFEATLTLNDAGECRLCVNGKERELWQVRRQALEGLFFRTFS